MAKYINILQSHEPLMDSGDYTIKVKEELKIPSKNINENFPETVRKFSVFGDRFELEPGSVHSVYPPAGSMGEHSNTFPHIILNRSTLPWERSATGGRDGIWLALLLFEEKETPKTETISLGEFKSQIGFKTTPSGENDNGPFHEIGDGPNEQPISVIKVKRSLLEKIMPTESDMNFTAHSRRETENNDKNALGKIGPERAVIIGNRLPKAGKMSTIHLVSLENRFHDGDGGFNYKGAAAEDLIQLISLKSWSFTSIDKKFSLFGMLEHINRSPSTLSRPHLNDQVVNLKLGADPIENESAYGFEVTNQNVAFDEGGARHVFLPDSFLSVEVPDLTIDADLNPQLDPFPEPTTFSLLLNVLPELNDEGYYAIAGAEEAGNFKPSLWYDAAKSNFEYRVTSENGVQYHGVIPSVFSNEFVNIIWVKTEEEFRFYINGTLVHTAPAPGRIYTKDSPYLIGKVNDGSLTFLGKIDQFQTYRRALTIGEIKELTSNNDDTKSMINDYLSRGMVPMPHFLRKGKKGVSWYRTPLSVNANNINFDYPLASSDELVIIDETSGMFDMSYAAAWQLGQITALENREFSLLLYNLKRQSALAEKLESQTNARTGHMKLGDQLNQKNIDALTGKINTWLERFHFLEEIPFHYLVPEESMLLPESIRFFKIDPTWINCLKDGAISIGRTTSADFKRDKKATFSTHTDLNLSGFLLRSKLVSGYPSLQITAQAQSTFDPRMVVEVEPKKIIRLSENLMLCLFEGEIESVDFFQKPDVLHFGLDSSGADFSKQLRKADGANLDGVVALDDSHWKNKAEKVLNFATLASSMQTKLKSILSATESAEFDNFTSADFAMEMLEGVEKVRFKN